MHGHSRDGTLSAAWTMAIRRAPAALAHAAARAGRGLGVRLVVLLLVAAALAAVVFSPDVRRLEATGLVELSELGGWAPLFLVAGYCATAALLLPVFPLDFAAGAHFDFWLGVLWVQVAATLAAVVGHVLGGTILKRVVDRFLERNPRMAQLRDAVQREGWKIVFLTRLSPVFSFSILNFLFGAARIPLGPYLAATFLGMLPGTALYVAAGNLAGDLSGSPRDPAQPTWLWVAQTAGFLATIALVVLVTRRAQRSLARRIEEEPAAAPTAPV